MPILSISCFLGFSAARYFTTTATIGDKQSAGQRAWLTAFVKRIVNRVCENGVKRNKTAVDEVSHFNVCVAVTLGTFRVPSFSGPRSSR